MWMPQIEAKAKEIEYPAIRSAASTLLVIDSIVSSMSTIWLLRKPLAGSLETPMTLIFSRSGETEAITVVILVVPISMAEISWAFGIVNKLRLVYQTLNQFFLALAPPF